MDVLKHNGIAESKFIGDIMKVLIYILLGVALLLPGCQEPTYTHLPPITMEECKVKLDMLNRMWVEALMWRWRLDDLDPETTDASGVFMGYKYGSKVGDCRHNVWRMERHLIDIHNHIVEQSCNVCEIRSY